MHQTHRRPPALPWNPSATAAVGFVSTLAGATYATPAFDAVAVVWRVTPSGVARGSARVLGALAVPPGLVGLATRSRRLAAAVAGAELAALAAVGLGYEVSTRRARAAWLAKPRNARPEPGVRVPMWRAGHLVGLGVGATTPHAADAMCRLIAEHADLPLYLVAATRAHARLYRRFGFVPAGPTCYGETPMWRAPGPLAAAVPAEPAAARADEREVAAS